MASELMKKVMARYLFNQDTKPGDILDENLIRDVSTTNNLVKGTKIDINLPDFMANGAGRYAFPALSEFVRHFFDPDYDRYLTLLDIENYLSSIGDNRSSYEQFPGTSVSYEFSKDLMTKAYNHKFGTSEANISFDFQHYSYQLEGESDLEFAERVFLWNSVEFTLGDEVKFVYLSSGSRWLEDFSIIPIQKASGQSSKKENFDFNSDDGAAKYSGPLSKARLDISDIGRRVDFDFIGSSSLTTFSQADYLNSVTLENSSRTNFYYTGEAGAIAGLYSYIDPLYHDLFKNGPADFYDTANSNSITDAGELTSLSDVGISSITLSNTQDGAFVGGNEVRSNSTYTRDDGTSAAIASVNFIVNPNGLLYTNDGSIITAEDGSVSVNAVSDINDESVDVSTKGVNGVTSAIGNIGNDTLVGDALFNESDNWLTGNLGEDILIGGAGKDYLIAA